MLFNLFYFNEKSSKKKNTNPFKNELPIFFFLSFDFYFYFYYFVFGENVVTSMSIGYTFNGSIQNMTS